MEREELHSKFNNLHSHMNNFVNQLNYNNLTSNLQSKLEINNQIQLNNKNLADEIQLILNTSKLQTKFQSEIYHTILKNKLIFQNFSIESNFNRIH